MLTAETAVVFFTASVLLALAPGPDILFVLAQSALHGRNAGFLVTLGLCTGLLGHTAAVAIGVAAVFQASAVAFTALKLAGAAYLLWLAWQVLRTPVEEQGEVAAPSAPPGVLYRRGIVMNLTNPKVSIFFLAFLPQFADPVRGSIPLQMIELGALFMLATALVFGAIAALAGTLGQALARSARIRKVMNRVAAAVFAGLALRLIASGR